MAVFLERHAVDLIGYSLTIISIIVGVLVVVWQLGRQHQNSLRLQRDNAREELKLRLYEIFVEKVRKLSLTNSRAGSYVNMIPFSLENYQAQLAVGLHPSPIKERTPEFLKLHGEAGNALVELIEEFESWSIAFPGGEIFKMAFGVAHHDANEAFGPLFIALLNALPADPPESAPPNVPRPLLHAPLSSEKIAELKALIARYKEASDDIGSYAYDLTVEAQNNLLSGLFERRVPARQPIDPAYKVISTDSAQAIRLRGYFENETSWGKANKSAQADARARLEKP